MIYVHQYKYESMQLILPKCFLDLHKLGLHKINSQFNDLLQLILEIKKS